MREYGVKVKIARLAQTFSAGILPGENRVFAQFAKSVISGRLFFGVYEITLLILKEEMILEILEMIKLKRKQ